MARPPINAKGELLFRQQLNAALDYVESLGGGGGGGATDLGYTAATRLLTSSTGADVTLPLASTDPGLMSAADKIKLDGIATGATAGTSLLTVEVNVGNTARRSGKFTIAGTGMTVGKPVFINQAVGPYTGKGARADEAEMDQMAVTASVTSATVITAYWRATGPMRGNVKFNYFVGA